MSRSIFRDSEVCFEYGISRRAAPPMLIRVVFDRPIPNTRRMVRCATLFASQARYEEHRRELDSTGCEIVTCHRYLLDQK